MKSHETIILSRKEVRNLLTAQECLMAVENAFKLYGNGKTSPPGILGIQANGGAFHMKAGILNLERNYFVMKSNGNFPGNKKNDLPTIQGVIIVADADDGRLLAIMDSIEITIIRTGAATGVAAKYLSRENSKTATIIGCGNQGKISVQMLMQVRKLEKIFLYDLDKTVAVRLREELKAADAFEQGEPAIEIANDWPDATKNSDIVVTCTPSKKAFLSHEHISPGAFIAAVGSDNDDKQEVKPALLSKSKIVCDVTAQCATIGELHHALEDRVLKNENVYAELGEVIAGKKPGRTSKDEIIIFDSTGMALQDVAAAAIVYERASKSETVMKRIFND